MSVSSAGRRVTRLAHPALRASLSTFVRARVPVSEVDDIVQSALAEALAAERAPEDDDENRGLGPRDRAPQGRRLVPARAQGIAARPAARRDGRGHRDRAAERARPLAVGDAGAAGRRRARAHLRVDAPRGGGREARVDRGRGGATGAARTAARLAASKALQGAMGGGDRRAPGPCDGRLPRAPQAAEGGDRAAAVALPGAERGAASAAAAGVDARRSGRRASPGRREGTDAGAQHRPLDAWAERRAVAEVDHGSHDAARARYGQAVVGAAAAAEDGPQNKPESMSDAPMPDEPAPEK